MEIMPRQVLDQSIKPSKQTFIILTTVLCRIQESMSSFLHVLIEENILVGVLLAYFLFNSVLLAEKLSVVIIACLQEKA